MQVKHVAAVLRQGGNLPHRHLEQHLKLLSLRKGLIRDLASPARKCNALQHWVPVAVFNLQKVKRSHGRRFPRAGPSANRSYGFCGQGATEAPKPRKPPSHYSETGGTVKWWGCKLARCFVAFRSLRSLSCNKIFSESPQSRMQRHSWSVVWSPRRQRKIAQAFCRLGSRSQAPEFSQGPRGIFSNNPEGSFKSKS